MDYNIPVERQLNFDAAAIMLKAADDMEQMRGLLDQSQRALNIAEIIVDADEQVQAFQLIQAVRHAIRAALSAERKEGPE